MRKDGSPDIGKVRKDFDFIGPVSLPLKSSKVTLSENKSPFLPFSIFPFVIYVITRFSIRCESKIESPVAA